MNIKIRIEFNGEKIVRKISLLKGEIKSLKILIVFDKILYKMIFSRLMMLK